MAHTAISVLSKLISSKKDADGSIKVDLSGSFKNEVVKYATGLDKLIVDATPAAINLWSAFRIYATPKGVTLTPEERKIVGSGSMTALQFFHMFDESIPEKNPKVGSAERKALNAHPVLNRLNYLTYKVGRIAAGEGPKPRDPKVASQKAKREESAFGAWAKKYKVPANGLQELVKNVMRMRSKDGKLTKRGIKYLKAAGLSVAA